MQISRVQSNNAFQRPANANKASTAQENPFTLRGNDGPQAQKPGARQDRQQEDGVKQQRIKQLQLLLQQQQQEIAKLQQDFAKQMQGINPSDLGKRSIESAAFQDALGTKTGKLSQLSQSLSNELSSGSLGGFVGQQGNGSGLRLSVRA